MANNCYNFTKLSGPKKKIDKFFNACNVFKESRYRDVDMSVAVAHSVRPMPEELDLISEGWAHIDGIDAKYWWTIDKGISFEMRAGPRSSGSRPSPCPLFWRSVRVPRQYRARPPLGLTR